MTKTERNRVIAWRLKLLRQASVTAKGLANTCHRFVVKAVKKFSH